MSTRILPIDLQQVHQQTAVNRAARETSVVLDENLLRRTLAQRAAQLAQRTSDEQRTAKGDSVLIFLRGAERFALDLSHIVRVCLLPDCTPLPGVVQGLVGVANFDGEVRSVVDILPVLGITAPREDAPLFGLLAKLEETELAILADRVELITRFHSDDIRAPDAVSDESAVNICRGVGPENTTVLEIEKLFAAFNLSAAT